MSQVPSIINNFGAIHFDKIHKSRKIGAPRRLAILNRTKMNSPVTQTPRYYGPIS